MARRTITVLLAASLAIAPAPLFAQAAPAAPATAAAPAATTVAPVVVPGRRRTPVELQPRSAACEAAMEDPYARELVAAGAAIYRRTRPPRNPDYNAPPAVLPDAPLPEVKSLADRSLRALGRDAVGEDAQGLAYAAAIAECLNPVRRGRSSGPSTAQSGMGPGEAFWLRMTSPLNPHSSAVNPIYAIEARGRAAIKRNDTTLPLAFALFDQGRYEMALEAFKLAHKKLPDADGGDEAALMIGKIYLYALRDKSDPAEGIAWLKRAAGAAFNPARDTQTFDPRRPDWTTPIGEASMILADLYATGHEGIPRDPAQSRKYLERAAETGYIPASAALGDLYYQGVDTPRDLAKAFRHYSNAARVAHVPAMTAVARMYEAGEAPGGPDPAKALAWRNEAAKFDDPEGLYALAVAYDRGEGVTADPERAIGFYKVSAVGGYAPAMTAIGTYFYTGEQVPQDLEVARGWFEQAAMGADADGMVNLAAMMVRGEGGETDRVKAWGWLTIAESLGHPDAVLALRALKPQLTVADRAGIDDFSRGAPAPPANVAPGPDPERDIDHAFVGAAPGGPPWWKVTKGAATVWIMGLPAGRTLETQNWNSRPFRETLSGARLLFTSNAAWSQAKLTPGPWYALPGELGKRVTAAAVKIREPLRNREPTLSDALATHRAYYLKNRLTDRTSIDVYQIARTRRAAIATPPVRPSPPLPSFDTAGDGVAACVEAILADINQPPAASQAASAAWAGGDVAGALKAPPGAEWACQVLWPDQWDRAVGFHAEAIAMALDMPGKVVAAIDIGQLVARDGVLPRLRAMGLEVSGPMQPTGDR